VLTGEFEKATDVANAVKSAGTARWVAIGGGLDQLLHQLQPAFRRSLAAHGSQDLPHAASVTPLPSRRLDLPAADQVLAEAFDDSRPVDCCLADRGGAATVILELD